MYELAICRSDQSSGSVIAASSLMAQAPMEKFNENHI
jgi:hypothetical protein